MLEDPNTQICFFWVHRDVKKILKMQSKGMLNTEFRILFTQMGAEGTEDGDTSHWGIYGFCWVYIGYKTFHCACFLSRE